MLPIMNIESQSETEHLLRSPANGRRLREAVERLEEDKGTSHDLLHEE